MCVVHQQTKEKVLGEQHNIVRSIYYVLLFMEFSLMLVKIYLLISVNVSIHLTM